VMSSEIRTHLRLYFYQQASVGLQMEFVQMRSMTPVRVTLPQNVIQTLERQFDLTSITGGRGALAKRRPFSGLRALQASANQRLHRLLLNAARKPMNRQPASFSLEDGLVATVQRVSGQELHFKLLSLFRNFDARLAG
jgi:hypothetical protein